MSVTGPYVTELSTPTNYSRKVGWKQDKPFVAVLPYECKRESVFTSTVVWPAGNMLPADVISSYWSSDWDIAVNACYDKLKAKMSERAQLGVTIAEANQAYAMIHDRSIQLYRMFRKLRRGDLAGAQQTLNIAVGKSKPASKAMADLYLEVHFGALPLYSDIHDAVKVIQDPIKAQWVKATHSGKYKKIQLSPHDAGEIPGRTYPNPYKWDSDRYINMSHDVAMGAQVAVDNPNLWLANQMGLVNPLTVMWELVPFSFVVDWVVNVGQVLGAYSDFYGLSVTNAWTSFRARGDFHYHNTYSMMVAGNNPGERIFWDSSTIQGGRYIHLRRQEGLVRPSLVLNGERAWGWRRAAAAMSLLFQVLHR